jgi:hypothetical protein
VTSNFCPSQRRPVHLHVGLQSGHPLAPPPERRNYGCCGPQSPQRQGRTRSDARPEAEKVKVVIRKISGQRSQCFRRFQFEELLQVIVGGQGVTFAVHIHVLCGRSRFFESACSETWAVDKGPITLPNDDAETFNSYLRLIYLKELQFYVEETFGVSKEVRVQEGFRRLIMLWILSDKLGDLQGCNSVISTLVLWAEDCKRVPEGPLVLTMMDHKTAHSPLRRLFVDWFVQDAQQSSYDSLGIHGDGQMLNFLLAVAKEFASRRANAPPTCKVGEVFKASVYRKPKCHYHQHDTACPPCDQSIFSRNPVVLV